jgi:hypothetical protein
LITSSNKKFRMAEGFVPTVHRARTRAADRKPLQLYCGYEDFPLPESLNSTVQGPRHISTS